MEPVDRRREILQSPEFRALARRRNVIAAVLTILTLATYFGYIALVAFAKEFMSRHLWGSVSVGIPVGIGVIVLSSLLTGIYVWWANVRYDAMAREAHERLKGP
jgi:uncharacterized membrane protein (DUF485 family)